VPDVSIRRADSGDAEALAALFGVIYEDSSHPCRDPDFIRRSLAGSDDLWLVADAGGTIAACTGLAWHAWNELFETCRSLTHPDWRGRGLARRLYERALTVAYARPDTALTIGWPRSRSMFELMSVGLARPLVITGHDGAPNVVGGEREFHLLGVTADRARLRRVAPRTPSWRALRPFLVDAVLAPLGLDDEPGVYPGDWVAGPTGGEQLSRQGWRVSFTRQSGGATPALDDARLAVQVTGICAETWRDAAAGVGALLRAFSHAAHVSVHVLADKELLIAALRELGFRVTAYLPAWFPAGQRRHDCLLLCRRTAAIVPRCHGTEDLVARFDAGLNPAPTATRWPTAS
jgi:GNAT superfamily N-acetyltransferase